MDSLENAISRVDPGMYDSVGSSIYHLYLQVSKYRNAHAGRHCRHANSMVKGGKRTTFLTRGFERVHCIDTDYRQTLVFESLHEPRSRRHVPPGSYQ